MDCGKVSKEGRKCQCTKTRPTVHGMRWPGTVRTGRASSKQKMQAGLCHQAGGAGVGANVPVAADSSDLDMTFESFVRSCISADVKGRLKANTWLTKEHILRTKLVPYFRQAKNQRDFHSKEVITWQNEMLALPGRERASRTRTTYLKTLHNQLERRFQSCGAATTI